MYKIIRFYYDSFYRGGRRRITLKTGLTLEQARQHCQDPEASSRTATCAIAKRRTRERGPWFDAYEKT